jgi:hypothetical protein
MSAQGIIISLLIFLVVVAALAVIWKIYKFARSFTKTCDATTPHVHQTNCDGSVSDVVPVEGGFGASVSLGGGSAAMNAGAGADMMEQDSAAGHQGVHFNEYANQYIY